MEKKYRTEKQLEAHREREKGTFRAYCMRKWGKRAFLKEKGKDGKPLISKDFVRKHYHEITSPAIRRKAIFFLNTVKR